MSLYEIMKSAQSQTCQYYCKGNLISDSPFIDKHVYKATWKENRALDQKSSEKFIPFIREHFTVYSSDFCKNCRVLAHVTVNYLVND